jgi:hypothetical protein
VLVGAGDIGACYGRGAERTGALLDNIDGTVFTAGDNSQSDGSVETFTDCYDPA